MIELFFWPTPNGYKATIALAELGLLGKVTPINILAGEQFDPAFLKISPNNKVPAIIDHDGPNGEPVAIFESGAILLYLAEKTRKLLPKSEVKRLEALQWLFFQVSSMGPMLGQAHHFRTYAPEKIEYAVDRYTQEAARLYKVLDNRLADHEYLADEFSIANAVPKQFRLNDDGHILYQADPTNPMPGVVLATVVKGASALQPDVSVLDTNLIEGQDREAITVKLKEWLKGHIATVLEPLVALENPEEGIAAPVRGIAFQVYEAMGIVPRANLEELIAGLDPEMRKELRQKQIKLGPILVFIPALNKPAAVHLRALLWSLWHDKPIPAKIPADGMVSTAFPTRSNAAASTLEVCKPLG